MPNIFAPSMVLLGVFAGCALEGDDGDLALGAATFELSGTYPGYITTTFGTSLANRCAIDPVADITNLPTNPNYVLSYKSGKSTCSIPAPYHDGGYLEHRQSIQRLYSTNTSKNYLLVSASLDGGTDYPGFEIIDMAAHGATTLHLGSAGVTPSTPPNCTDHIVARATSITTARRHAGGMQAYGTYAVVGFEGSSTAYFQAVDLYNPTSPTVYPAVFRQHGQTGNAGAVAITRTSDLTYIVMVFGDGASDVEVFLSSSTGIPATAAGWTSKGAWSTGFATSYENVQLVTKCDGALFAVATHKNGSGQDWADLFRVTLNSATYQPSFVQVANRHVYCSSSFTGGVRFCDFAAGAGPFVDSSGHLILYGVEHYDDAYPDNGTGVKVREF